ncbi:MAG: class I SAM-dependent methyltransferase [Chthoniobacteraceae bacterium]
MPLDPIQQAAQEQFARQSRNYGRNHILADVRDIVEALGSIPLPAQMDVLDVATGGGHTGLHLASLGHRVTCSDLAPAMLERVREAAAERGLSIETREHPAEALPYPDGSFDLVTSRVAPHHFSSPRDFVRESARVLRTGGYFLLIDGSIEDGQFEAEAWSHELEKLRDPSHARFLTPSQWRELCINAGLRVSRTNLQPMKQPDLEWYFETAGTPPENRAKVRRMIATAPVSVRHLFRLGEEEGRIVWWWQRLTLIARKD